MTTPIVKGAVLAVVAAAFFYLGTLFPDLIQGNPDTLQGTVVEASEGSLLVMTSEGERRVAVPRGAFIKVVSETSLETPAGIPIGADVLFFGLNEDATAASMVTAYPAQEPLAQ